MDGPVLLIIFVVAAALSFVFLRIVFRSSSSNAPVLSRWAPALFALLLLAIGISMLFL